MRLLLAAALLLPWPVGAPAQTANVSQDAPPPSPPPQRQRRKRPQADSGFNPRALPCPPGTHAVLGQGPHLSTDRTRSRTMRKSAPARRCAPNGPAQAPKTAKPASDAAPATTPGADAKPAANGR